MSRPTRIYIDTDALRHNLQRVRALAPSAAIIAMIKANAYGHGLLKVAEALSGAQAFGVATIEEALHLRQSSIKKPIVLMEGFFAPSELITIAANHLDIVVHSFEQITAIEATLLQKPIKVWLKVNTGMNRLGFLPTQVAEAKARLAACSAIKQPLGLMTHFADADDVSKATTMQQIKVFQEVAHETQAPLSLANSAGIIAWPDTHADWVRPGLMLYGVSPFADEAGSKYDLKPVMTVESALIAVHQCHKGDTIGYGSNWTCPEDMPVGVVAMGYGDGYPYQAPNGTPVLVNGKASQLIGRVSMDMLTVDLREQPHATVGDPVTLWGPGLPVETVAKHVGTIPYELLCAVKSRYKL